MLDPLHDFKGTALGQLGLDDEAELARWLDVPPGHLSGTADRSRLHDLVDRWNRRAHQHPHLQHIVLIEHEGETEILLGHRESEP
jgi:hypothetical protein